MTTETMYEILAHALYTVTGFALGYILADIKLEAYNWKNKKKK